jgi:hypothetical protein
MKINPLQSYYLFYKRNGGNSFIKEKAGSDTIWTEEAVAIVNAILLNSGTLTDAKKNSIAELVFNAKAHGWWDKIIGIYGLLGGTSASHAINWKKIGTYNMIWSGTLSHSSSGTYSGGGYGYCSYYITSFPNSGALSLAFYSASNFTDKRVCGSRVAWGSDLMLAHESSYGGVRFDAFYNYAAGSSISDRSGLLVGVRDSSGYKRLFKDGAVILSGGLGNGTIPNKQMYLLAIDGVSGYIATGVTCGFFSFGYEMSNDLVATFSYDINAFLKSIGRKS